MHYVSLSQFNHFFIILNYEALLRASRLYLKIIFAAVKCANCIDWRYMLLGTCKG